MRARPSTRIRTLFSASRAPWTGSVLLCKIFSKILRQPRRGFHVWKVCVAVPPEIQADLSGDYDPSLICNFENDWCESSIPELHRILGRRYGPVHGDRKEDDHIFTLQSWSLPNVMTALRYIASSILRSEATSGPRCGGFYTGGTPSQIPAALSTYAELFAAAADMYVCGLPVGYLVRPEMYPSRFKMLLRPCHLQVKLPSALAMYLMSDSRLHHLRMRMRGMPIYEVSQNANSEAHMCDIGATGHDDIAKTVAELAEVLQQASYPGISQSVMRPGW